ncbi:MAG: DUF4192 domain-containing protein [Bifidobacteriaceae bacterium]|nr:DUF4192 domain-containing protein [Bifidobacteriaceae bacterium]
MTQPTVIRAHCAADILACIPHQLGFVPTSSLVLLSVHAERGKVGLAIRLDLPDIHTIANPTEFIDYVTGLLIDDAAGMVFIVRYPGPGDPAAPADKSVRRLADAVGRKVGCVEIWEVGEERYEQLDPNTWRPTGEGGPTDDLVGTVTAAAFAAAGSNPLASRASVGQLPDPPEVDRRKARRAASRAWDKRTRGGSEGLHAWRVSMLDVWRRALEDLVSAQEAGLRELPLDPRVLGEITAGANDPAVKRGIVGIIAGRQELADRSVLEGDASVASFDQLLDPRSGVELDPGVSQGAERLLAVAAAHASKFRKGALFELLAWLAWTLGDGVRARVECERALECPGVHSLAGFVRTALAYGLSPRCPNTARRLLGTDGWAA